MTHFFVFVVLLILKKINKKLEIKIKNLYFKIINYCIMLLPRGWALFAARAKLPADMKKKKKKPRQ